MGRAEELFKRIQDNGAAEVHRMISAELVEELYLDYKRSSTTLPAAKLSDEDRKNLAKAIAGFANSEGGVIVWGVDCRQTAQGDVPTKPVLINQQSRNTTFEQDRLFSRHRTVCWQGCSGVRLSRTWPPSSRS